ncbi:AAA family ATPase [Brevundimonas bullata]|uniref:ParA family protein n=1 Tax=Brevundimonas bullata TaxID=13160 RepID=UPI000E0B9CB6|nr:AAA family ATPase [Brevundimonas bullata]WQE36099.1 AAA family ATPase [Brevundimonas bullata]
MKIVSVINFKGGVSKTTLSFHLACHLAKTSRVLLIDVDHQSSLSIVALGSAAWQTRVTAGRTVNRIFESFTNRKVAMPGAEIIVNNPMSSRYPGYSYYSNLSLVPAQFELDDIEIDLASTTMGNATISDWEKRTLLASWLDFIDADNNYDYVVIDCPPATKIVSQNAIACSDGFIVPVIPDELSSRGVTHFLSLVQTKIDGKLKQLKQDGRIDSAATPKSYVADTNLVAIAPSILKTAGRAASGVTNIHTTQLAQLRARRGNQVLDTISTNLIGVPEALNVGLPVWAVKTSNSVKARPMMTKICTELKIRIDAL